MRARPSARLFAVACVCTRGRVWVVLRVWSLRGQGKGRDAWQGVHGRIQTACEVGAGILLPSPPGVQLIQKPEGFIEIREQLDLAESFGAAPSQRCRRHCSGANRCAFAELSRMNRMRRCSSRRTRFRNRRCECRRTVQCAECRPPDGHDRRKAVHAHVCQPGAKRTLLCTLRANVHLFSIVFGA